MQLIQINLEEWQYDVLLARAEQENRSISELVREILREKLIQPGLGRAVSKKLKVSVRIRQRPDEPTINSLGRRRT